MTSRPLDVQPDRSHQRERVAVLDHAGPHPVVEDHPAVLQPILECTLATGAPSVDAQLGQRQIVRRHQADRAGSTRRARSPSAPMRRSCELVPRENLVEQEQQRHGPRADRRSCGCGESRRRTASARPAASRRCAASRRAPAATAAAAGPHRRPGQRQHDVDADRPQQRALARHVRAADDQRARMTARRAARRFARRPARRSADARARSRRTADRRRRSPETDRPGVRRRRWPAPRALRSRRPPAATPRPPGRRPHAIDRSPTAICWRTQQQCAIGLNSRLSVA